MITIHIKRAKFLLFFGFLSFFIAGCYYIGYYLDLFWLFSWYDIPLHILGGLWATFFVFGLYFSISQKIPTGKVFYPTLFLGMLFIAILWESYELIVGLVDFNDEEYVLDTVKDFTNDFIGAIFAFFTLKYFYTRDMIVK